METIKVLVEGGKATAAPPVGPALAAAKLNVGQVVSAVNEKTKEFSGMQVPVTISYDTKTKEFSISVGTPPVSSLIKKELKLQKLAKTAWKEPSPGNLTIEQAVKIAKAKLDSLGTKDLKKAVKQVVASCVSLGVTVENKNPKETLKDIDSGIFDEKIKA